MIKQLFISLALCVSATLTVPTMASADDAASGVTVEKFKRSPLKAKADDGKVMEITFKDLKGSEAGSSVAVVEMTGRFVFVKLNDGRIVQIQKIDLQLAGEAERKQACLPEHLVASNNSLSTNSTQLGSGGQCKK